uniref:NADH dehydrogenase subunit 6 n=1 Tax=Polyplax spinulosa TaxID=468197 RepID=V9PXB4_9NEOP|nr:NADH dehydrogenase subunit 6 [Polyplax spinulosa]
MFLIFVTFFLALGASPQGVVNLIAMTFFSGLFILAYAESVWPGSMFLLGIVGGLVVLMSFTFMMFPKESYKESFKFNLLKHSWLTMAPLGMFLFLSWETGESTSWASDSKASSSLSPSSVWSMSDSLILFSPFLLVFIFMFLLIILLAVESVTKLIG